MLVLDMIFIWMDLSRGTKSIGTFEMFFSCFGPFGVWGVTGNVEVEEVERKWKGEKGEEEWEEKKMVGSCWKTLKRWECI